MNFNQNNFEVQTFHSGHKTTGRVLRLVVVEIIAGVATTRVTSRMPLLSQYHAALESKSKNNTDFKKYILNIIKEKFCTA